MSDDGSGRQPGWLFDEDAPRGRPSPPAPRRKINFRSVDLWLNVGFIVVMIGLVIGASTSPWYFVVAVAWMVLGVTVISRSRRNRPAPPNLFEDDEPPRNNG